MSNVLVIAPHADDETRGCGGTLLRHASEGSDTSWLIMTDPDESLGYSNDFIKRRENEIKNVASMYNFKSVHRGNFATTTLDTIPMNDIVASISTVVSETEPEII